jgi:AraC-like DNA-binding protein/mannose-6-phosphate isomerase-like protein (cupin superfamily)
MGEATGMEILNIPIGVNKKDSRIHGNYEFPVAVYDTKLENLLYGFINWHWHDEMHFYMVRNGRVAFYVNSSVFNLDEGDGVFINCGCMHMVKPLGGGGNSIITFFVHPKLFSGFHGSAIERKYVKPFIQKDKLAGVALRIEEQWQNAILERLKKIYELCSTKLWGYELDITLDWMQIWRSMIMSNIPVENEETGACCHGDYQKMKTILGYINKHYAEKITLDEIAATVNLSRNECCRFFKRSANCTLFEYIMDYRISKGSELLQSNDMSVKEVAYIVGFGDASYFITRFKRKTGYTPKEYRNKIRADSNTDAESGSLVFPAWGHQLP